ncbi:MAG: hypothetical protein HY291_18910 [Planctomycetes bacterium]|nr:hypothetical protein [Planctomycetota bacterium]
MSTPADAASSPASEPAHPPKIPSASPEEPVPIASALATQAGPTEEFTTPGARAAAAASTLPPVTRADCTRLGIRIFLIGVSLPVIAAALLPSAANLIAYALGTTPALASFNVGHAALALYFVAPPAALFGAMMGFEAFRVISGSRKPLHLHNAAWFVLGLLFLPFFATVWLILPLYLHSHLRRELLAGEPQPDVLRSLLHLVYMCLWPLALFVGTTGLSEAFRSSVSSGMRETGVSLAICTWSALWICDYLMLLMFASWRSVRILAAPPSKTAQYSLGALLATTLGLAAWVSGLVLLFR